MSTISKQMERGDATEIVRSPPHYTAGGIETIDFIEAKGLDYHLANVVKYVSRAGRKDPARYVEDLQKAQWYLERAIARAQQAVAVATDSKPHT